MDFFASSHWVHSLCFDFFVHVRFICLCVQCLVLYVYARCIIVTWWGEPGEIESSLDVWMTNHPPSVLWHCWLGHQTCKTTIAEMTCDVSCWMLKLTQISVLQHVSMCIWKHTSTWDLQACCSVQFNLFNSDLWTTEHHNAISLNWQDYNSSNINSLWTQPTHPCGAVELHTWTDRNDVMKGTMTWYPGALVLRNKAPPYTVHIISKSVYSTSC